MIPRQPWFGPNGHPWLPRRGKAARASLPLRAPKSGGLQPQTASKSVLRTLCRSLMVILLFAAGAIWHFGKVSRHGFMDSAAADTLPGDGLSEQHGEPRRLDTEGKGTLIMVHEGHLRETGCPSGDVCVKDGKQYMLMFYVMGILYMFFAVAIVCDEFFVPALECFVDTFNITMDVAGATFMAAGGSMPELATSFIGTFQKSDIGFSTIVGSAVFNVLLVIGVCAVFSDEPLPLTWWPFFRDVVYYIFCLSTLAVFFSGTSQSEIEWWEALILLLEYFSYIVLMKFNNQVSDWVHGLLARAGRKIHPEPSGDQVEGIDGRSEGGEEYVNPFFHKPSTFRHGIVDILTHNQDIVETAGIVAITKIKGNLHETFRELDKDEDDFIDGHDIQQLLEKLGVDHSHDRDAIALAASSISRREDGRISFEAFSKWYLGNQIRMEVMMHRVFNRFDTDSNGTIDRNEVRHMMQSLGHHLDENGITAIIKEIHEAGAEALAEATKQIDGLGPGDACQVKELGAEDTAKPGDGEDDHDLHRINFAQFEAWYTKSLFWEQKLAEIQHEADEHGFSIEWPDEPRGRALFWYLFTYPICAALYVTMPDVRRPHHEGWEFRAAVAQFSMSLLWIIFFSFCLVDWVTVTSNSLGIPVNVAAITVLAAGTSIPDLLSSYIVARQGHGDMAVSSSIGSNIFDICFGLPVPWLAYHLIKGQRVKVESKAIGFSVLVLVLMLVCVIACIMYSKWRMTLRMGYAMLALYLVFLVQNIVQEIPEGDPLVGPADF